MAKSSSEYWRDRTVARLVASEVKGVKTIANILPIYQQAEDNIAKEIKKDC